MSAVCECFFVRKVQYSFVPQGIVGRIFSLAINTMIGRDGAREWRHSSGRTTADGRRLTLTDT
jgi:hypothetical protein